VRIAATKLEVDSTELATILADPAYLDSTGFKKEALLSLFIPNTYQFKWSTSTKAFLKRMQKEYNKFWTPERKAKASAKKLSVQEVATLASIVDQETNQADEMDMVAGVYLNRLKKDWPLQADPTVKFALQDFGLRRILNKHLEYDSPYNTYKYPGLPPGPICIPSMQALNGVLDATDHKYMFFCAKPDGSGYHSFAQTLKEHNRNAKEYHKMLNKRKIK